MSAPRFHCPGLETASGAEITLPDAAAHHAMRVLRLRVGDAVVLFNGSGDAWQGRIAAGGKTVSVSIDQIQQGSSEPALAVTLVQALPGGDKMDWVVQKAVELGVGQIQPVSGKRSVVKLAGERAQKRGAHWQEVAAGACEQCGRNVVPPVLPLLDLGQYLAQFRSANQQGFLLVPGAGKRLRELAMPAGPVHLLVG